MQSTRASSASRAMARSRGASAPARPTCASAWPAAWRACACGWERRMIETDDFLADLERHLREAAEQRDEKLARSRRGPGAVLRPRRHAARRLGAAGLAVLGVAALAAVIGVVRGGPAPPPDDRAVTTPSAVPPPSPQADAQGRRIALQAAARVKRARVCRPAPSAVPAVVATPLSPAIAKLVPGLAPGRGVDPATLRLEPMSARGVLRSSARRLRLRSGLTATVYVLDGLPAGDLADPAGCLHARLAQAAALAAGQSAAVQQAAERHVRDFRESALDLQTLMLQVGRAGVQGRFGRGLPVWSRHAPRPGVAVSGDAGTDRRAYIGIADPRATHVLVHTRKPFTVSVEHGFYGVVLTGRTGRVVLDETAADGTVVATRRVR